MCLDSLILGKKELRFREGKGSVHDQTDGVVHEETRTSVSKFMALTSVPWFPALPRC